MATPEQLLEAGKATQFAPGHNVGAATRFGAENANMHSSDERNPNKPWSIQKQMRRLAVQEIEFDENGNFPDKIKSRKVMAAYAYAYANMVKILKGDARHLEICLERLDGKVEQTINMKEFKAILEADDAVLDEIIASGMIEDKAAK